MLINKYLFLLQVVHNSGYGWEIFKLEGEEHRGIANLKSHVPLDFENERHVKHFKFKVEVTDQVI